MRAYLSALGAGLLFGIGLWLSGMADPRKVLGFLDVAGDWDPSLLAVMAGAVAVTAAAFRPLMKWRGVATTGTGVDARLVGGAALFGAGWGIAGYCPGPAVTALSLLGPDVFVFVAAMIAGGFVARIWPSSGPGA